MLRLPIKRFRGNRMMKKLQVAMIEVAKVSDHRGYFYHVQDVLTVMILGLFCGLKTIEEIYQWSQVPKNLKFFEEEFAVKKLPSKSHFYNILTYVNHKKFSEEFNNWIQGFIPNNLEGVTISIDGKSIRSTKHFAENKQAISIASAIIANTGLVIASKECLGKKCDDEAAGEVGAFRDIIESLEVKGAMIVADALHCNQTSAEAVVKAGADYLFVVKENNKNLRESIELTAYNKKIDTFKTVDLNGGRIETRIAYVAHEIAHIGDIKKWKKATCVGAIYREFEKNGKISSQWHYYISSRKLTAKELLNHARLEWRVESMHWVLDVHFKEDSTLVRDMRVQKNLNMMRKIVINFVKQYQMSLEKKKSLVGIMRANLFDIDQFLRFIAHFRR